MDTETPGLTGHCWKCFTLVICRCSPAVRNNVLYDQRYAMKCFSLRLSQSTRGVIWVSQDITFYRFGKTLQ